jgi:hypothetical protein
MSFFSKKPAGAAVDEQPPAAAESSAAPPPAEKPKSTVNWQDLIAGKSAPPPPEAPSAPHKTALDPATKEILARAGEDAWKALFKDKKKDESQ